MASFIGSIFRSLLVASVGKLCAEIYAWNQENTESENKATEDHQGVLGVFCRFPLPDPLQSHVINY